MRSVPLLALFVVSALWGSHPVVGRVVENHLSPLSLSIWRFTFASLCYLPFIGRLKSIFKLRPRLFWQLALSGICWAVIYPLLYYSSLKYVSATQSLLLVNTSPILAALFAWVFLRERLNRYEWGGIAIAFLGVVALVAMQWSGNLAWSGVGLALAAAAAFAAYTVSSKTLFQQLPLVNVLMATTVWGAIGLWVVTWIHGDAGTVILSLSSFTSTAWAQLLYIVVVVSTLAYALYGYGLPRVPAGLASAVTFYPQVLFAAVIEWIWLGDAPDVMTVVSGLLILSGIALMRKKPKQRNISSAGGDDLLSQVKTL